MHSSYRRYRRSRYRRRKMFAFGATVLVVFLGLWGLSLFSPDTSLESQKGEVVSSVHKPDSANVPEAVEKAKKEKKKDKEKAEAKKKEKQKKKQAEKKDPDPAPPNNTMSLTVPRLGLQANTVRNSSSEWALNHGAAKMPGTGFPWESGDTNTYISGHRWGYKGTESYYQFLNLPSMRRGDMVYLTDSAGRTYEYRVTKEIQVYQTERWVTAPVAGKDVVSLQTCLYPPDWSYRLIVRAVRVD